MSPAHVENFGLTLLESAATGLPFIGTQNGGPVDIVENTESGLLVDLDSDPGNLTAAMKRLLTDEPLWQRLSDNGIQHRGGRPPHPRGVEPRLRRLYAHRLPRVPR